MSDSKPRSSAKGRRSSRLEQLLATLRAKLPELRRLYGVRTMGVFGSYVRGSQNPDSDLDVLVEFSRTPSLLDFVGLEQELSEMLGVKVDLVMKSALKHAIGERIMQEVVAL